MERPSDPALTSPSTPQACEIPPSPHTHSSGKQPMSATLRERLRRTRSSFHSCYSTVVKRLKVEDEERDESFSDKTISSTHESCLGFQESVKHRGSECEESTHLNNAIEEISARDATPLDGGPSSARQNDSVHENLPSPGGVQGERAMLVKQIQEKEDFLRRLKLVKMYRSKNDLSHIQLLIKKWRSCSQLVLYELQSAMSEENKKRSLTELIDHYGLDDHLLHYNRSEEEFIGV
ncbi:swi5-dependent recombination DNA repair protein 1 homolog [Tenrec ecaudatus]|uniref:swi5-dependent recombination DNA repair protein 1 homolog n=1 Tax=Tenrec ecaudatus TaxID=94439 RepID=UPI003F594875